MATDAGGGIVSGRRGGGERVAVGFDRRRLASMCAEQRSGGVRRRAGGGGGHRDREVQGPTVVVGCRPPDGSISVVSLGAVNPGARRRDGLGKHERCRLSYSGSD